MILIKETFAQIIGIIAVITFLLSYQLKSRRNIIALNVISRCLYILQYFLLGAIAGALLDILGAASSVIADKKDVGFIKRNKRIVFISVNSVILITGITIAFINKNALDLFPMLGVLLHTGAFWITDEKIIRRISLAGSPFWLIYNLICRAYGSAIGDALTISSIIIAMIKYRKIKTKMPESESDNI